METALGLFNSDIVTDINLLGLSFRLCLGLILSVIIVFHYNNYSTCLSERAHFSRIFPFILLTTLLVISVVQSSLALSLGLVGALSIVRFRTPIKEPEDLAYLFICIAAGVGLGAGAVLVTLMSVVFILTAATLFFRITKRHMSIPHFLNISKKNTKEDFDDILETISRHTTSEPKIRRVDYNAEEIDALLHLSISSDSSILEMLSELRAKWPSADFTVMDQSRTPIS